MEDNAEIIPALQDKSIISVGIADYHKVALTIDGKLYSWGSFSRGALGLGEPDKSPVGAPGGYRTRRQLNQARAGSYTDVPDVEIPAEIHFEHGEKESFCLATTTAGWHAGALVIDLDPEVSQNEAAKRHSNNTFIGRKKTKSRIGQK